MSGNLLQAILQDESGTLSAALDLFGSAQGTVLYRDGAKWAALGPGTAGQGFASGGPGANPFWAGAVTTALQPSDIGVSIQAHSSILDATTAAYTATKDTKLAGIATGADVTATAVNATAKGTPVDTDRVIGSDSAASFGVVYATWTQAKAFLKTYFDTLYQPLVAALTSWGAITRATGYDTFAATPSSANLRALLTDEVGTGAAYFVGGALGTPASGTATNLTGLPVSSGISGLAANMAAFLAGGTSAQLAAALTDETGTGAAVFANAPTISGIPVFSGIPSLTGGALSFPATQVPSAGVNDLDDYEEGTWTPVASSTAGTVTTFGTVLGTYTKIGNVVHVNIQIPITTNGTGAGALQVTGLPYAPRASSGRWALAGKEVGVSNKSANGVITGAVTNVTSIHFADGTYPGANGAIVVLTGHYLTD